MTIINNCFSKRTFFIIPLVLFLTISTLLAQESGTIRGKITDKTTGEALIGANVIIKGTSLGAASDISGNYITQVDRIDSKSLKR